MHNSWIKHKFFASVTPSLSIEGESEGEGEKLEYCCINLFHPSSESFRVKKKRNLWDSTDDISTDMVARVCNNLIATILHIEYDARNVK